MNIVVAVAGPITSSSLPPSCPSCCSVVLVVDRPSTSRPVIVVFHVVIIRCPSTTIVGTCLRRFSADSPEQHRRGEEDPIHPPSSYFLLIVVYIAVKEIIVINTSSPSHSSAHCPAITLTTAIAIVAVSPRPLQRPVPPHGKPSDDPNEYYGDDGITTRARGGRLLQRLCRRRPNSVRCPVLDVPGLVLEVGREDVLVLSNVVVGRLTGGHHFFVTATVAAVGEGGGGGRRGEEGGGSWSWRCGGCCCCFVCVCECVWCDVAGNYFPAVAGQIFLRN